MTFSAISGYSDAALRLGTFSATDFRVVRRLEVEQHGPDRAACAVRLTLESEPPRATWTITLVAENVRDLRITSWGGKETRLIGLDCVDVSARQWEDVHWQVVDYENDMIHFYCADLRIEDVRPVNVVKSEPR